MLNKKINNIILRILIVTIGIALGFYTYHNQLIYTSIFIGFVTFILILEIYTYIKNVFVFYDKAVLAILNKDFSADYSKHENAPDYQNLIKLYNNVKNQQFDVESKEFVYKSIFDAIETGVLILQSENESWNVFLMNEFFSTELMVPKVSKWQYLKNQIPSFCEAIENKNFEEFKTSVEIKIGNEELQTYILQTSKTKTFNTDFYVIIINSIQQVIDKKEKEAWNNLMKIISHELLNSITPIRSLTQNLNELMQQETLSIEDIQDIKESASAMVYRSNHLQNFVESYRKLAMLPSPQKQRILLSELIENTVKIIIPELSQYGIQLELEKDFRYYINVDVQQMEQVLINLILNSMSALQNETFKKIKIGAHTKNNRVYIHIEDSGKGIEREIQDKIFLPFFTTRKEGAGIGLTLSKNIVEAHGGYLSYIIENKNTKFTICLID